MKMTADHVAHIAAAIAPFDTAENRSLYARGGQSDKRYHFDLLFVAGLNPWLCNVAYRYLKDTHVATALRSIVAPLRRVAA